MGFILPQTSIKRGRAIIAFRKVAFVSADAKTANGKFYLSKSSEERIEFTGAVPFIKETTSIKERKTPKKER